MNTQNFHKCEWVSNKISEDLKFHPLYMYMYKDNLAAGLLKTGELTTSGE